MVTLHKIYRIKTQQDNVCPHSKGDDTKIIDLISQPAYSPGVSVKNYFKLPSIQNQRPLEYIDDLIAFGQLAVEKIEHSFLFECESPMLSINTYLEI